MSPDMPPHFPSVLSALVGVGPRFLDCGLNTPGNSGPQLRYAPGGTLLEVL